MASRENIGKRDLSYSEWHRVDSIKRFIGKSSAKSLAMLDIDFLEYHYFAGEPVLFKQLKLIWNETQPSKSYHERCVKGTKPYIVLAEKAWYANNHGPGLVYKYAPPVYLVYYKLSNDPNISAKRSDVMDIEMFKVLKLWPPGEKSLVSLSPKEWASKLVDIRKNFNRVFLPVYNKYKREKNGIYY